MGQRPRPPPRPRPRPRPRRPPARRTARPPARPHRPRRKTWLSLSLSPDSTQHYFWKGIDGNLWQATIYPDGTKEGPYNRGFGPLGSAPTAGVDSKGATFVAWKGTDGDVAHLVRRNSDGVDGVGGTVAVGPDWLMWSPTSTCRSVAYRGARGGIRTRTPLRAMDFESTVSAIPPLGLPPSAPSMVVGRARPVRRNGFSAAGGAARPGRGGPTRPLRRCCQQFSAGTWEQSEAAMRIG